MDKTTLMFLGLQYALVISTADQQCQFECNSLEDPQIGICLPLTSVCNGVVECIEKTDEINCPSMRKCHTTEYACHNGQCIDIDWVCDGDNDCPDQSDETICPDRNCKMNQFRCNDGSCISTLWRCDLDLDCKDGSDESSCVSNVTSLCPDSYFRCNNTDQCLPRSLVCDGETDCDDFTDELNCQGKYVRCGPDEFFCGGMCISESWRCDGDADCEDQSDERGCNATTCTNDQFRCDSGRCIHANWQCDGEVDCTDNSDERSCPDDETKMVCIHDHFRCTTSKQCVAMDKVCDGRSDCSDKADEVNCDKPTSCESFETMGCCKNSTHNFTVCSCPPGFELTNDKKHCNDYDECMFNDMCSQQCVNFAGSFSCVCADGYRLESDSRSCNVLSAGDEPFILLASRVEIRKLIPGNQDHQATQHNLLVHGLQNVASLDVHVEYELLFWIDVTLDHIKVLHLNASITQFNILDVVSVGLDTPGGIACDWIHDKLFWTDSGTARIEVANLDGSMRKVIVWENLEKPRAIAAHPGQGTIFWTDWGSPAKIERSSMDGNDRRVIINTSIFWPNGLTIDYAANKLYWTDAKHHVIETSSLDGLLRRTVVSRGLSHPFGVAVLGNDLYWTDWHTKTVNRIGKLNSEEIETVISQSHYPMDIRIFHPLRQPYYANRCQMNNGGCSHLCLPTLSGYICACPTGFRLILNRRHCTENLSNFIVFATSTDLRRISLDTNDGTDVVIPVSGLKKAVALDWDDVTDYLYWSDLSSDSISMARWDGTGQEVVVSASVDSPAGLAIDWITRKLYWSDAGRKRIEVAEIVQMDSRLRTILIWDKLEKPRDIAVDPVSGMMYWTDWGREAKIERAGMDGSSRQTLIDSNLTMPSSLAIDHGQNRLYWSDATRRCIEYIDLVDLRRETLISLNLKHPFGVAVHDDRIYWTDWVTHSIESVNKLDGSDRQVLRTNIRDLMDIHVFHRRRPQVDSPCLRDNAGCSHLCLISPKSSKYACKCPVGVLLLPDGKTCSSGMNNLLLFSRQTTLHAVSLDVSYFADVVIPISTGMQNFVTADIDISTDSIYWSDITKHTIDSLSLTTGSSQEESVVTTGLDAVDGLAVDVTGRMLYWSDAERNHIQVMSLVQRIRTISNGGVFGDIRGYTSYSSLSSLHATYMFWTDWGRDPRIERADMDGLNRLSLITHNLGWPNGITVDFKTSRIIWVDAKTEVIECASLDGSDRQLLVTAVLLPYGIAVFNDFIYWTDRQEQAIFRANSSTGDNKTMMLDGLSGIMDIRAISMQATGSDNVCGTNNGGCSHFCLRNPTGFSCRCSTGILLSSDNVTCFQEPKRYLLVAMKYHVVRISLETPDMTDVQLPLVDVHNVIALDVDVADKRMYYSDVYLDVIRRCNLSGSNVDTIVTSGTSTMDGLAVDWIAKNVYWTDRGRDVIEVSRLDGSNRMILISSDLDEPRAIVLHPQKGFLFWSDWGLNSKIERSFLDGTDRKAIISSDIGWPNGLCIGHEEEMVYWADARLDRIETSDFNGQLRRQLLDQVHHPFGLALYGDYIYVSDWQLRGIERFDKRNGRGRVVIRSKLDGIMDIRVVAEDIQTGSNPCSTNNGGCSHLCFHRPNGHVCLIPDENASLSKNWTNENKLLPSESTDQTPLNTTLIIVVIIGTVTAVLLVLIGVLLVRSVSDGSTHSRTHLTLKPSTLFRWRMLQSPHSGTEDVSSAVSTSSYRMIPLLDTSQVRQIHDADTVFDGDESDVSLAESGVSLSGSHTNVSTRD